MNQPSQEPSKKRVIIVTAAMAIIVLGLLVAVIAVAVNKNAKKPVSETAVSGEVAVDSLASPSNQNNNSSESNKKPEEENLAPVSNEQGSSSTSSESVSSGTTSSDSLAVPGYADPTNLPATGATDFLGFLPLALLAGMTTTFLVSLYYSRRSI